jgi:hypothetical protein
MATSTIRSSRLGRNSCSGGSSVRMTTGKPSMAVNRPAKSLRCMGRSLAGPCGGLFVARQDHGLHVLDAVLGEEHVLGAAQADAFGAELAGGLGVARDVGIGAHAELAAELVGPLHELQRTPEEFGSASSVLALPEDFAGGAVERKPVAFLQGDGLCRRR